MSSSYKGRLACTNSFTAVNYYTEQILWSCPALKILWVCNFAQLILCPVMSFILLLHSLYSLNAVVCGKKGKMQTPTLTASTPSSGKSTNQQRFSLLCIKLLFFDSDTAFSGRKKAALQGCLACVLWNAVPCMVRDYIFTNWME